MTISQVNDVCADRYACGVVAVEPVAVLWLAEHILETTGLNVWKMISRLRTKHGRYTPFPAYGTKLFNTL